MYYLFQLSGENLKLAQIELKALLSLYGLRRFACSKISQRIIKIKSSLSEKEIYKLCKRSALLKWCAAEIGKVKKFDELGDFDWSWVKSPYCVRVEIGQRQLEKKIASLIWTALRRPSVDLENPKTTIYVLVDKKGILISKLLWKREKGRFVEREPAKKPAFHPTALKPKLARLLVNLARCKEKEILLDPFCGTGSVLIEAAVIGCKPVGSDIDWWMLKASKINLSRYGLKAELRQINAAELDKHILSNSIDAIATDPPYGRSSHIGAKNVRELYKDFLNSARRVLKRGRYLAMLYPHYIKFKIPKGWQIIDRASIYVHGGLIRRILVLRKK